MIQIGCQNSDICNIPSDAPVFTALNTSLITSEQYEAACNASIACTDIVKYSTDGEISSEEITFTAFGQAPNINIPITITYPGGGYSANSYYN